MEKLQKKWSSTDIAYLRAHYDTSTIHELEKALGRTYTGITSKAKQLGITGLRAKGRPSHADKAAALQQKDVPLRDRCYPTRDAVTGRVAVRIDRRTVVLMPQGYTAKQLQKITKLIKAVK